MTPDLIEAVARRIYYIAPPLEWIETGGTSGHSGAAIPFEDERSGIYRKAAEQHARAALAAIDASGTHRVVPVVATKGMVERGAFYAADELQSNAADCWAAMLAAYPKETR